MIGLELSTLSQIKVRAMTIDPFFPIRPYSNEFVFLYEHV
jgi:hypothetical protein